MSNICIRCGTQRIVVKTWKEKIGESTITNTQTACPNKECQKKVDQDNKKTLDKYKDIQIKNEERRVARNAARKVK
ncbi:MAG: hypothetical protein WCO06_02515 [Candidatus Roizmanbacteria bacterium]